MNSMLVTLRRSWRSLVAADVLFKVLAYVLLTPLVGLLFRLFLAASGRTILVDADIARFVLHPLGWIAVIAIGGATVAIFALEQATLMTILVAARHEVPHHTRTALRFVAGKSTGIYRIAGRMVARVLLLAAPFLAIAGATYYMLLTDRDINFYLAGKPPRFWLAAGIIALDLSILAALVVRCVVNWSIAFQLHLFENVPPGECLASSRRQVIGHRRRIAVRVVAWWVITSLIGLCASWLVLALAEWIVPATVNSLWRLALTLGCLLALLGIVNLACNVLGVISFAVLQIAAYDRCRTSEALRLPELDPAALLPFPKLTRRRMIAAVTVGLVAATLVGAWTINSVEIEDRVEITAHRAGAARAPENTLAAVRQAIEDGADWVEIDVQESRDGVVVVIHDSDLARVAGVNTRIWEATADELRSHDIGSFFGPDFSAERVPTLAEVLELCQGKVRVNIELKYYGHDVELVPKVVALVEEHDMVDQVVLMSLNAGQVRRAQQMRPDWTVGLLTAVARGDLTRAEADFLAVSAKLATRAFVRQAHARGRHVHAWTINDAAAMSTMISRGVDNLITDRPDLARQVLADRAALEPTERMLIDLAIRFGIMPLKASEQ